MSGLSRVRRRWTPPLAAAVLALGMGGPASANHEPARLGLTPVDQPGTYFELTLDPGETRELRVEAANFGHEEVLARTYAADVYTIVNGGFGADLFGERPSNATLWLTYPTEEITLGPDEALVIDFDVTVPDGTAPGEYVTALVIENVEPVRGSGTIAVDQVNRSAIAVAIEVPGETRAALSIGQVRHQVVAGFSVVSFEVGNPGDVHLRPTGDYVLRDGSGSEIASGRVPMDSVYAGTSTTLEAPGVAELPAGDYCAELTLTDAETGATDASECLPFTIAAPPADDAPFGVPGIADVVDTVGGVPLGVWLVALIGLGGSGAFIAGLAMRRRRRAAVAGAATEWPASDPGSAAPALEDALPTIAGSLRRVLDEHPEIRRAWIVERGSGLVLAVEGPPGATAAEGSRLSAMLQERADREVGRIMPLHVVCVQGEGPVARMTGGTVPFYVRAARS